MVQPQVKRDHQGRDRSGVDGGRLHDLPFDQQSHRVQSMHRPLFDASGLHAAPRNRAGDSV